MGGGDRRCLRRDTSGRAHSRALQRSRAGRAFTWNKLLASVMETADHPTVWTRHSSSAPGRATMARQVRIASAGEETRAMRTSFSVNDMTIHRIVEQESGFTPMLDFLPTLSKETLGENLSWLAPGGYDSASGNVVLCFQSYVVKTPHHNILVDSCIGNDKNFPLRPTWNKKNDANWMKALKAAGLGVEDIDFVMCTPSARRSRRLEHAAGERPLGPDLSEGALPVLEKGIHLLERDPSEDAARPDHRQRAADHRGQPGRTGQQRSCAQRPYPLEPDPGPHARPFRGLRRQGRRRRGVHRRPDPFADPGPLSRAGHARRHRPRPGRPDAPRISSSATAIPTRLCCTMHFPSPSVGHIKRWGDGFRLEYAKG